MIDGMEFYERLKGYKRELLRLKQLKHASCNSRYYIYRIAVSQYYNTAWLIQYKGGDQPIITEALSYSDVSLSVPNSNQQYLFAYSQVIAEIVIFSTREIESVTEISS